MFGIYEAVILAEPQVKHWLTSKAFERLLEVGDEIERLRRELGYTETFPLFKKYLEYRQMRGSNAPGEPKLAVQFLEEIGKG